MSGEDRAGQMNRRTAVTLAGGLAALNLRTKASQHHVRAERQGQVKLRLPPFAEVDDIVETGFRIRQLTFVDHKTNGVFKLGLALLAIDP